MQHARHRYRLSGALLALALVLAACDTGSLHAPEAATEHTPLPPNVRVQMSYDQTEISYSRIWPDDMISSVGKGASEGAELMTDFERTFHISRIDEAGYVYSEYTYIEGHPDMNMPEDVYNDNKETMPYNPANEDPVVRMEMFDGVHRYLRASGEVAHEVAYDKEEMRIDPALLDSMIAQQQSPVSQRVAFHRSVWMKQGHQLQDIDAVQVGLTQELPNGSGSVRQVIDLRFGKPTLLAYRNDEGRPTLVIRNRYAEVSGIPVLRESVSLEFGEISGTWGVTAKNVTTRERIQVQVAR